MPHSGFTQQFFDQLVQFSKIWRANIGFDDFTPFVDDVGGGCEFHISPGFGNGACIVQRNLKRQLAGLCKVKNITGWVITHSYSQRVIPLVFVFVISCNELRHLGDAGRTTGRPEIDQGHFTQQILGGLATAVEQHEVRLWSKLRRIAPVRINPQAYDNGQRDASHPVFRCYFWHKLH